MNIRTFKSNIIEIIWDCVKAHCNVPRHYDVSMTSKNYGFFFKIHRYGQDLQISIWQNGDIGIKIKECCHADQNSAYYCYHEKHDHEALLPLIQNDMNLLIQDFYHGMDYSALADLHISFSLFRKETDWMDAYSSVRP